MTTTYLDAARHTATWLIDVAERTPEGWHWFEKPAVAKAEAGVGWGTGGPSLFFVELYRTTGDDRWLEPAFEAERWMGAHLEELSREWAGCGLLTGVGGWPVFAAELAAATGDDSHRELGRRTVQLIASRATRDQDGLHWHGYTEMLWGTSGIGCLLLRQGRDVLGDRAVHMAVEAGDWVLRQAAPVGPDGLRWTIGPAYDACGSAGVAEWFLDLHALEGGAEDLAFARRMVDDLLTRAISDERGMRWSNYEHRNEEPHLPPEPTYLQGASGIGSTLCRLDRHLRGDRWVVGWPHAPRWT